MMAAMLPVRPPEPPKRRGVPPTLVLWLTGVVAIVVLDQVRKLLHRFHVSTSAVTFLALLAWPTSSTCIPCRPPRPPHSERGWRCPELRSKHAKRESWPP